MFDADHDGEISIHGLGRVMRNHGLNPTAEELADMIRLENNNKQQLAKIIVENNGKVQRKNNLVTQRAAPFVLFARGLSTEYKFLLPLLAVVWRGRNV